MKIAITGATGQLGRIIISKLKEKVDKENIIALVRSVEKAAELEVEAREADYDKPITLEKALDGVDILLLISGSEVGKRATQHQNVIDAAKKKDINWIVYTSLLHADTSKISLAEEHVITEKALRESGIEHTILRNGWYIENYMGNIGGTIAGGAVLGSAKDGKISAASREDYAEAAVSVLTSEGHKNRVYELAGDQSFTLSDLAAQISKVSEKNIVYKDMPVDEYAKILTGFGLPAGLAAAIAGWDEGIAKDDLYDESKQLSALIGRPTKSLAAAVADAVSKG